MTIAERFRAYRREHRPLWRFYPERRLAIALALTAPLWLLPGRSGSIAGGAALAIVFVLVIADMLLLPSRSAVVVERELATSVGVGDTEHGLYTISNRTMRALHVNLRDAFPPEIVGGIRSLDVSLPPLSQVAEEFSITGMKRGNVGPGPVGLRALAALRLISARYLLSMDDELRVVPSISGVKRLRLAAMQHRMSSLGVRTLRRKGEGQGFASLREYALGDEPRHIDWKATARRGKVITREFTIERSQTVITVVDAGRAMTQLAGTYTRFEQALSAALVLTDIAANAGDRVGTMVFDQEVRAFVPAQQSRGALKTIREAFAPVSASTSEPDYANAFRFLAAHQRKRALIVLFTDVIDVRASQALLAHVSRSASRHLVLCVALRNDDMFSAAVPTQTGGSALRVYRSAAAEEVIQAREEALERMRRAGVIVLDVFPSAMTVSVLNRYLDLKARGAL